MQLYVLTLTISGAYLALLFGIASELRIAAVLSDERVDELVVAQGRYQIGDVYFVLDGNHRVSVARVRGVE